jgi:hypothetical protein
VAARKPAHRLAEIAGLREMTIRIVAQSSAEAELAKCLISAALLILGEDEDLLWDRHGTGVSPCPRA